MTALGTLGGTQSFGKRPNAAGRWPGGPSRPVCDAATQPSVGKQRRRRRGGTMYNLGPLGGTNAMRYRSTPPVRYRRSGTRPEIQNSIHFVEQRRSNGHLRPDVNSDRLGGTARNGGAIKQRTQCLVSMRLLDAATRHALEATTPTVPARDATIWERAADRKFCTRPSNQWFRSQAFLTRLWNKRLIKLLCGRHDSEWPMRHDAGLATWRTQQLSYNLGAGGQ